MTHSVGLAPLAFLVHRIGGQDDVARGDATLEVASMGRLDLAVLIEHQVSDCELSDSRSNDDRLGDLCESAIDHDGTSARHWVGIDI